jgi:hypothetical protein
MKLSLLHHKLAFYLALLFGLLLLTVPTWTVTAQTTGATETPTPTMTPTATATMPAAQLALTAVQPNSVSNSSDTELIITGSGFVDGAVVVLNNSGGLQTTFVSGNLLRAVLPMGTAAGTYTVTVVNPDAKSVSLPNALTVTALAASIFCSVTETFAENG